MTTPYVPFTLDLSKIMVAAKSRSIGAMWTFEPLKMEVHFETDHDSYKSVIDHFNGLFGKTK